MKRFISNCFLVGAVSIITFACGGGGSKSSVSNVVDNGDSSSTDLDANSTSAFESSSWSTKTPATVDDSNAVTVSTSVQNTVSSVVSSATSKAQQSKKSGKTSYQVNETVTGTQGGTATVTGSFSTDTTAGSTYPITYDYDLKLVFANYKDGTIAINGEVTYKGDAVISSATSTKTTIDVKGGYSVLYQDNAYNLVTDIHAEITVTNSSQISVTYSYTVNGQSFTGTYNLGS